MSPVCLVTITKNITCVPGHCHHKQSAQLVQFVLLCAVLRAQEAGMTNPRPAGNLQPVGLFHTAVAYVVPNAMYSSTLSNDLLIESDFFTSLKAQLSPPSLDE